MAKWQTASWYGSAIDRHAPALLLLAVFWLALVLIANPSGNFPLNDDWNYARTVKSLLEEHKLLVTQWSLAASLTQALIGVLACLPAGFSFEALRYSTILLGFMAAAGCYFMCLRAGASRVLALFLALVLCTNPLFFNLSLTFMTDIPFLALTSLTILLLARQLDKSKAAQAGPISSVAAFSSWQTLVVSVLVAAVCLLRQTGLVIPIAFAVIRMAIFYRRAGSDRNAYSGSVSGGVQAAVEALVPLLVSVFLVSSFQVWLGKTAGTLYCYRVEEAYLQSHFAKGALYVIVDTAENIIKAFVYLGLFTLPAMPLVFPHFWRILEKKERYFFAILAAEVASLFALLLIFTGSRMPLADNVFYNFGLGPLLLGLGPAGVIWPAAPPLRMQSLGLIGSLGAALLFSILGAGIIRWRKRQPLYASPAAGNICLLSLTSLVLYLSVICLRGFFDRYLLFPLLLLMPAVAAASAFVPGVNAIAADAGAGSGADAGADVVPRSGPKSLSENPVCRGGPEGDSTAAQSATRAVPLHPPICPEAPPYGRMQCARTTDRGLFRQAPSCYLTSISVWAWLCWAAALALLLPLGWFAVAGTHDYLAWNRARWQLLNQLLAKQAVSAMDIDGGLEFNGWYGYDPRYRYGGGIVFNTSMCHNDIYAVTLAPVPGYAVLQRCSFRRWLPPGIGEILILKKRQDKNMPYRCMIKS